MIEREALCQLLHFDHATGIFTNLVDRGKAKKGKVAGHLYVTSKGISYWYITISGRCYPAHRLAWLYTHGSFPADQIDHINGDGLDNRISNLRPCTPSENNENLGISKRNKSGVAGVYWDRKGNAWVAGVKKNGINTRIRCATFAEAIEKRAYLKSKVHLFSPVQRNPNDVSDGHSI